MAATRVQSTGKVHDVPAVSMSASFGSLPSAGNLIIVEAISYGDTSAITAADFFDNQGNTYQVAAAATPNNGSATILYAQNIGSPSGTFTVTWQPTHGAAFLAMCCIEWSGMATSSVLDKSNTATGSSASPSVSTGTTNQANEVIIAVGYNDDQLSNSPFTKDAAFTEDFIEQDATQWLVGEGSYRIVSSTGSYTSTWSANNYPWSAAIASFKVAGGGAAVTFSQLERGTRGLMRGIYLG